MTRRRIAILGGYATVQVLVQAIAFASGLVLVRVLDQLEYGHYTLAISMVGMGGVLLDLGLSTAVLATGGPFHANATRLRSLLGDAFKLQRWLLLGTVLLAPAFLYMLMRQGLGAIVAVALVLLVLASSALGAYNAIALSIVRLRGDVNLQQRLDMGVNLGKLMLVLSAAAVFIDALIAVALNLFAAGITCWLLRSYLATHVGSTNASTGEAQPALRSFIRRQAPSSLYYCFMGQITIWLIGFLGDANRVAEVGALGRLAAVFAVVGAVLAAIVQPYFARRSHARELISGFVVLNVFFASLTAGLVVIAVLTPQALLWILGTRYAGLTYEVVWLVLSSSIGAWAAAIYGVGASRGWLVPAILQVPLGLCTLALSCWAFDVSTVAGCLMLTSSTVAVSLALALAMVIQKLLAACRSDRAPR